MLVGHRLWIFQRGKLESLCQNGVSRNFIAFHPRRYPTVWPSDFLEAQCSLQEAPPHPNKGEDCGIYAFFTPHDARNYIDEIADTLSHLAYPFLSHLVLGAVGLWGKIIVHEYGYRAQYAKPLAFFTDFGDYGCDYTNKDMEKLAAQYGADIAPFPKEDR